MNKLSDTYNSDIIENNQILEKLYKPDDTEQKYIILISKVDELNIDNTLSYLIQDIIIRYKKMKNDNPKLIVDYNLPEEILEKLKQIGCLFYNDNNEYNLLVKKAFCEYYNKCLIYREDKIINWCPFLQSSVYDINTIELKKPTKFMLPGYDKEISFGWVYELKYELYEKKIKKKINKSLLKSKTESYVSLLKKNVTFDKNIEQIQEKKYIHVLTTRPETIFGDVALLVNSSDLRYMDYVGQYVIHPFSKKLLPIIADNNNIVDMELNNGVMRLTPGHNMDDYINNKKYYNLEILNIFTDNGRLNKNCGMYEGINRFEARLKVIDDLKDMELYVGQKPINMKLNLCVKSGDVIEYMLKSNWYLDCTKITDKVKDIFKKDIIKLHQNNDKNKVYDWLDNNKSLCISTHSSNKLAYKIPAYNIKSVDNNINEWIVALNMDEVNMIIERDYSEIEDIEIIEDMMELEEWFISSIQLLINLGWGKNIQQNVYKMFSNEMENSKILESDSILEENILSFKSSESSMSDNNMIKYNVSIVDLVVGTNEIFNKYIKCIILGLELVNQIPFKNIYLHDSINLINTIDPFDIINGITSKDILNKTKNEKVYEYLNINFPNGIPKSSKDILRITLLNTIGNNNLNVDNINNNILFFNKISEIFKFSFYHLFENPFDRNNVVDFNNLEIHHKWIINKTIEFGAEIEKSIETFKLDRILELINTYWIDNLGNIYIKLIRYDLRDEINKNNLNDNIDSNKKTTTKLILFNILITSLKIIHPFIPYLSQYMYEKMRGPNNMLYTRPWPKFNLELINEENNINIIKEYIKRVHNNTSVEELLSTACIKSLENNLKFISS